MNRRELLCGMAVGSCGLAVPRLAFLDSALSPVTPSELAADPRRPQYHLLPAANWMNDPNGPIFWRGMYHMFYQYNPESAVWGDMHWGHAISPDMVHWRHLPVALAPTPGGPDAAGCFTGTALKDGDRVAVLYTGVVSAPEDDATIRDGAHSFRESQCLAIGTGKDLTHWTKAAAAVIPAPPPGLDVTGFRDPAPWRQGDTWYMAVGSGIRGKGGAVLLYRSHDLHHWEYLHLLAQGSGSGQQATNPVDSGNMWECPDFFPLGDRHVLIHSTGGKAYWQSGVFDTDALVFHPERGGVLDYGSFYAPKTQLDQRHNRILWGWITEARPAAEYSAAGWAGMMSLPRVLTLDPSYDLQTEVAPQVKSLRQREQTLRITGNEAADRQELAGMHIENGCGEIACSFRTGPEPLALSLISQENAGRAWITCRYDPAHPGELLIDDKPVPLGASENQQVELHFYIDGSVIECFANRYGPCTKRFYYPGSSTPPISMQLEGSLRNLVSVSMWALQPISRDRLTT